MGSAIKRRTLVALQVFAVLSLSAAFHPSGPVGTPGAHSSHRVVSGEVQIVQRHGQALGVLEARRASKDKGRQEHHEETVKNGLGELPNAVQRDLDTHVDLPVGSPVLVSVSGGSDSVALLRILVALNSEKRQWHLAVVHFNHGLRAEADAEEEFVKSLCAEHGVPIHIRRLASSNAAMVEHGSEGDWRAWRRNHSVAILRDLSATHMQDTEEQAVRGAIMLAHHADDQIETVLLKCLRGCHLSNLHGMRWQDGYFVRPLLGHRKAELQAYLHSVGQPWMEDSSNAEPKYKRNRVRLQLLPLLDELAGGALHARAEAIEQQSAQLREWLCQASEAHLQADPAWQHASATSSHAGQRGLSITRLQKQVPMLQDELLHILVSQAESGKGKSTEGSEMYEARPMPYVHLCLLREQLKRSIAEWSLDLANSCTVRRVGDLLTAVPLAAAHAHSSASESSDHEIDCPRKVIAVGNVTVHVHADWMVTAGLVADAQVPESSVVLRQLLTNTSLDVRSPQPGDRFHPTWKEKPIRLVSFLRGQHVPLDQRRSLPVICRSGTHEVLAVFNPPHVARSVASRGQANVEDADEHALWIAMNSMSV